MRHRFGDCVRRASFIHEKRHGGNVMHTKKIARMGMMIAVAFVLSYIESVMPLPTLIPGIKVGLPNMVIVLCLYEGTLIETFGIAILRIVLCGVTFGSLSTMIYSLAGGLLSFGVMLLLKKSDKFSIFGVSIAGGVSHNIGQIIIAIVILQTNLLIYYIPFLLLAGCIAGVAIGFISALLAKRLHGIFQE